MATTGSARRTCEPVCGRTMDAGVQSDPAHRCPVDHRFAPSDRKLVRSRFRWTLDQRAVAKRPDSSATANRRSGPRHTVRRTRRSQVEFPPDRPPEKPPAFPVAASCPPFGLCRLVRLPRLWRLQTPMTAVEPDPRRGWWCLGIGEIALRFGRGHGQLFNYQNSLT